MSAVSTDPAVYRSRAIPTRGRSLEDDPEPMVQQQLARLFFFEQVVGTRGARVLDWGCGTGFNCAWLHRHGGAREVFGFDLCRGTVQLARTAHPELRFAVADACDPTLDLRSGRWDRILSCEVLEHVPDMDAFLANLRRHLAPGGVAFVTTPNRPVFSLDHEPSPVNREHIKELDRTEFHALLHRHFPSAEVFGQRFARPELLESWQADVRAKIERCRAGTRWAERPALTARLRRLPLIDWAYRLAPLRWAWQTLRWGVVDRLARWLRPPRSPYRWSDFEFVTDDLSDSLWLCAVLRV
jgi:SAM-dependent methyltransferase